MVRTYYLPMSVISPLPQCLWLPNLTYSVVTYGVELQLIYIVT